MRVLVCTASRHGATAQIGDALAKALTDNGVPADARTPDQVADLQGYDALVLGSAVYMGSWLPSARQLVERISGQLSGRPVWLFSSGPVGERGSDSSKPPVDASQVITATAARDHRVFGGRIERAQLGIVHRTMMAAMHIADSDERDWDEIAAWGKHIAEELLTGAQPQPGPQTGPETEAGGAR